MTRAKTDKAQSLKTKTVDEEIDAAEIEEEDGVDHLKRNTDEAMEKMENAKIRCWNKTHKK